MIYSLPKKQLKFHKVTSKSGERVNRGGAFIKQVDKELMVISYYMIKLSTLIISL